MKELVFLLPSVKIPLFLYFSVFRIKKEIKLN